MKDWKNMTKRGLALLLTLVLCVGILQLPALAADESTGTVQDAATQDVTEETVTPSGPDTPADTTAPDADGSEDDTAPSDFYSKTPEAIEPPVTLGVPEPPTDDNIEDFYRNNIAVIVRCVDQRDSKHNGTLKRLAKGSYTMSSLVIGAIHPRSLPADSVCNNLFSRSLFLSASKGRFRTGTLRPEADGALTLRQALPGSWSHGRGK